MTLGTSAKNRLVRPGQPMAPASSIAARMQPGGATSAHPGARRPSLTEAMLDTRGGQGAATTAAGRAAAKQAAPVKLSSGTKLKLTASFARQMQVLVGTGIPLAHALHATCRQATNRTWRELIDRMATSVDEGRPLSTAMQDAKVFDEVAISLVAAGESSGNMPTMLERLADLKRRQLKLRNSVTGALAYPALLITMGTCVLITMLVFVLPRFEVLFASLDSPLPATTKMLMTASRILTSYWWACLLGVATVVTGVWMFFASGQGKAIFDRYYLRMPVVGKLGRSLLSARVARMLGTLLEAKVPLTEALELTRRSAVNDAFAALVARAESAVARGQPLSSILDASSNPNVVSGSDLLVPGVQEAIRNGEASGRLGQPLCQMAEFLEEENDVALKSLTSTLEPLILIFLGLVVGFIAISIFLPMFDMITAAQGGA
jgi:type II secretory pathway component PulF